jgi:D-3-phosphoglycerate dehydrogenase
MDAWRTSCPRLPVWEDALADGLVEVRREGAGDTLVALTAAGRAALDDGARGAVAAR